MDRPFNQLVKDLKDNIAWLGGFEKCFSREKKTRTYIDPILKYVCKKFMPPNHELNLEEAVPPKVYTDMEVELKVFNETVRPDY